MQKLWKNRCTSDWQKGILADVPCVSKTAGTINEASQQLDLLIAPARWIKGLAELAMNRT